MTWLADRLGAALLLFLVACFALPTEAASSLVFYLTVLPCLAASLALRRRPGGAAFDAGAALILWSAATLLWGWDDGGRTGGMALACFGTLAFWAALAIGLADSTARARLPLCLAGLGAADALIGLARYFFWPGNMVGDQVLRLEGWGVTFHPVLGGGVFSLCWLSALHAMSTSHRFGILWASAAAVIGAAILLTQSRGPELAAVLGLLAWLASGPARRWAAAGLVLPAAGWLAWRHGLIRAGDSGHVEVWRETWGQILARPVFGHGLAANLPLHLGADRSFPHDLYLSVLFYSGTIGVCLFLVWAGQVSRLLWLARATPEGRWALALWVSALVAGVTDFGQITKGPGALWIVLWLPAGLALTSAHGQREASAEGSWLPL